MFSKYEVYTETYSVYYYKDTDVLKNKFGIKSAELLREAEEEISIRKQIELVFEPINGRFTVSHLLNIHKYIKAEFVKAFNELLHNKEEILENCRLIQSTLTDCTAIASEINNLFCEIEVVTELTRKLIDDNFCNIIDQNEYIPKYDSYVKRYETAKAKLEKLQIQRHQRLAKRDAIGAFIFKLSERDEVLTEFDEGLFTLTVGRVVVKNYGVLEFEFKNGTEIEVEL